MDQCSTTTLWPYTPAMMDTILWETMRVLVSLLASGTTLTWNADVRYIRESVDSLCRDDADMPMPPYIGKAYNRPNDAFVSLFR